MSQPSHSLVHLTREPHRLQPGLPPLLLLLHGVGSNERDLFAMEDHLDVRFRVVSARAPLTLGPDSYAWFHATITDAEREFDSDEAEQSRLALVSFIGDVTGRYNTDPRRVYLMGFSQGAIMSLSVALTSPELVAGVVAMSGLLLPGVQPKIASPDLKGMPILVVHGTEDQLLPLHYGWNVRDRLSALPVDLTYREYPMGHEVTAQSLADVVAWLKDRLDS